MDFLTPERLLPMGKSTGFKMDGYYVWCGSCIKEADTYYLFAARWPKEKTFPSGYLTDSEIVLATTDSLDRPFEFKKVVLTKRDGEYWDSVMQHNPFVMKIGDEFVLFYIGSPDGGTANRAIGYATAKTLDGEWKRSDKKIDLPPDSNNPSVLLDKDGSILLYFRDGRLNVYVARSDRYDGEYKIERSNIFPLGIIEDMYVYIDSDGKYQMVAEDAGGKYTGLVKAGVHFVSDNGLDWQPHPSPLAYDYDILYDDGTRVELTRRERPQIFFDGDRVYLFNASKFGGDTRLTGGDTMNTVQEYSLK